MLYKKLISSLFIAVTGLVLSVSPAHAGYGDNLCKKNGFKCVKVKKGDTWGKLFSNSSERELVQRLNRMNIEPRGGQVIAVPKDLDSARLMDYAPFPKLIKVSDRTSRVVVSQKDLAWGAYDMRGQLLKWGPISAGKGYCKDIGEKCVTPQGDFQTIRKMGSDCVSTIFPANEGGAPMPYCIFFKGGIALHGSPEVPGYNASHGCVRLFVEDAAWLNNNFVEVGMTRVLVDKPIPAAPPGTVAKVYIEDLTPWH